MFASYFLYYTDRNKNNNSDNNKLITAYRIFVKANRKQTNDYSDDRKKIKGQKNQPSQPRPNQPTQQGNSEVINRTKIMIKNCTSDTSK